MAQQTNNKISQVKKFSTFLCMETCKSLGPQKSFLSYASELSGASILHFSHPLELLSAPYREWLQLIAVRQQVVFSAKLQAQKFIFGGLESLMTVAFSLTDMSGNIPFLNVSPQILYACFYPAFPKSSSLRSICNISLFLYFLMPNLLLSLLILLFHVIQAVEIIFKYQDLITIKYLYHYYSCLSHCHLSLGLLLQTPHCISCFSFFCLMFYSQKCRQNDPRNTFSIVIIVT